MLFILSLVLLILAIFLHVRHAEPRNIRQLVQEVSLETSHNYCNSQQHDDDQSNKEGLVVEGGLGDVGQVQRNVRN